MTESLWKHKKRGTTYRILSTIAGLQCSTRAELEEAFVAWTVYQSVDTDEIWVRPTTEFMDGRFERIWP